MFRVNLADEIRTARERAHLSQVELARELGVSPRTVQNWEAGRVPQHKHRRTLSAFLEAQSPPPDLAVVAGTGSEPKGSLHG